MSTTPDPRWTLGVRLVLDYEQPHELFRDALDRALRDGHFGGCAEPAAGDASEARLEARLDALGFTR